MCAVRSQSSILQAQRGCEQPEVQARRGTFFIQTICGRHLEGRKRARVVISGRVAWRDLLFILAKHKVSRSYSGAEEDAPSLTGARDDNLLMRGSLQVWSCWNAFTDRAP